MIEKIFIIAFMVMAIYSTMLYGMIFQIVRVKLDKAPQWLKKIVYDCPVCQTPYYGSAIYWLIWGNSVKEWIIVIIAAMGACSVLIRLFK